MVERLRRSDSKLAFVLDVRGSADPGSVLRTMLRFGSVAPLPTHFCLHPRPKGTNLLDQVVDVSFADDVHPVVGSRVPLAARSIEVLGNVPHLRRQTRLQLRERLLVKSCLPDSNAAQAEDCRGQLQPGVVCQREPGVQMEAIDPSLANVGSAMARSCLISSEEGETGRAASVMSVSASTPPPCR